MKIRLILLQIFFMLVAGFVWLRLAYWQVIAADSLQSQAQAQHQTAIELPALRGEIKSQDGFALVANSETYLLTANPKKYPLTLENFQTLQDLLPASDAAKLKDKLNSDLSWVVLASTLNPNLKEQIQKLKLAGFDFELNPQRLYPEGSMSAHLTGFVGQDEAGHPKGYFGLEGFYDRQLSGKPGRIIEEQDALGRPIVIGQNAKIPAKDGQNIVTTIDRVMQFISYQKLKTALEKYGAIGGTVTIMEPSSGKILAMVSLPDYDPTSYAQYDPQLYKNPVIAETYEPGSTFKVLVTAAAIDAGVITPDTRCTICNGPVDVADYTIKTWNNKYHPNSTVTEVLQHSDNVGMVFISRLLGKDKFLSYLKKFGFGTESKIDLQEEVAAPLRPDKSWLEIDLATASFGQGIAVTPIQMVRAVGAIANLGKLPNPYLVEPEEKQFKSVISAKTAAQLTQMMINSVERSEANWTRIKPKGYHIAGKTGTAQIPVAGHYDKDKTIASFIGFAPAEDPKFVMLVTLKEPKTSQWGSETAAPLWFEIATELFRYLKIPPRG